MSSCFVCALRFPDSSISSDPCCSSTDGSPEVSTPAIEVAPLSSNAAAAVAAIFACAAWNWALAWRSRTRTWDSLVCAADSCWLAWSSCWLTLSNWVVSWLILAWTWLTLGCGAAPAPVAKTTRPLNETSPAAIAIPRRIRDTLPASRVFTSLPLPTMSPLAERLPSSLALATGPAAFGPA